MNTETKNFIETCDFINIDTSSLMETDSLLNFLENYGSTIIKSGRTIFVCREVIAELKLLCRSAKPLKVHQAATALTMLYDNSDLFRLEDDPDNVDVKIVHKRIADQRIISAVTWYKVQHSQLFISNDKALLHAIVTADQMDAVHGKPVYATSLSESGELIEYSCIENLNFEEVDAGAEMDNRYTDGQISGAFWGGLLSAIVVGGVSHLLHSHTKNLESDY